MNESKTVHETTEIVGSSSPSQKLEKNKELVILRGTLLHPFPKEKNSFFY